MGNILWKTMQISVVGYNHCALTRLYVDASECLALVDAIRRLGSWKVTTKINRRETDIRSDAEKSRAERLLREARKILTP